LLRYRPSTATRSIACSLPRRWLRTWRSSQAIGPSGSTKGGWSRL